MRSDEQYHLEWDNEDLKLDDITSEFGTSPGNPDWLQIQEFAEPCRWENLEEDMRRASIRFPETLFTVKITNCDTRERHVQYHRGGRHYEAKEVPSLPEFDETLLME